MRVGDEPKDGSSGNSQSPVCMHNWMDSGPTETTHEQDVPLTVMW